MRLLGFWETHLDFWHGKPTFLYCGEISLYFWGQPQLSWIHWLHLVIENRPFSLKHPIIIRVTNNWNARELGIAFTILVMALFIRFTKTFHHCHPRYKEVVIIDMFCFLVDFHGALALWFHFNALINKLLSHLVFNFKAFSHFYFLNFDY